MLHPSQEGGLFLDIIIPEEYDPRICREKDIKYKVAVDDPVKLELLKAEREVHSKYRVSSIAST